MLPLCDVILISMKYHIYISLPTLKCHDLWNIIVIDVPKTRWCSKGNLYYNTYFIFCNVYNPFYLMEATKRELFSTHSCKGGHNVSFLVNLYNTTKLSHAIGPRLFQFTLIGWYCSTVNILASKYLPNIGRPDPEGVRRVRPLTAQTK
jgi:hypothetical protein